LDGQEIKLHLEESLFRRAISYGDRVAMLPVTRRARVAAVDGNAEVRTATFGAILRRHRGRLGLTQEELARRAGVRTQQVSQLERGVIRARAAQRSSSWPAR
jgi:DNA-binding XRE family transcriptional regulator